MFEAAAIRLRRLGYDVNGTAVSNKLGPGVLAPNGVVPMTGDLNAASNTITNLKAPSQDSDAATKVYVDNIAGSTTVQDLRSSEYNDYAAGNLFVATGEKKLIISAGSIVSGPFVQGQTISGNNSGATGTIVDLKTTTGVEGNVVEISYTPVSGTFTDGIPAGGGETQDVVSVVGGAQGTLVRGPIDVWANGIVTANSDITFTVGSTIDGSNQLSITIGGISSIASVTAASSATSTSNTLSTTLGTVQGQGTGGVTSSSALSNVNASTSAVLEQASLNIEAVDYAVETAKLTKNILLNKIALSLSAQANNVDASKLDLLR